MALKKGDVCFRAELSGTKVEFREYILRTIQTRAGRYSWEKPETWGYWWCKVPGLSWGKRSKKHGDYGWLKNADPICRVKHRLQDGRPYGATKAGAIREEIAAIRELIREYGPDCDLDEEGVTLDQQLKAALRVQARLKGAAK